MIVIHESKVQNEPSNYAMLDALRVLHRILVAEAG